MICLDGQGLGKNVVKKIGDNWEWAMWIDLSEWAKDFKVFVHSEHSPNDDLSRILIIKCIGWPILWIPVSSFPIHLSMGLWTKWPCWQEWKLYMNSATLTSTYQGQQRQTLGPRYGTVPWGGHQPTWYRIIMLDYFCCGSSSPFFLLDQTLTLDMDLLFLHIVLPPTLSSMDLWNTLSSTLVFHRHHFF